MLIIAESLSHFLPKKIVPSTFHVPTLLLQLQTFSKFLSITESSSWAAVATHVIKYCCTALTTMYKATKSNEILPCTLFYSTLPHTSIFRSLLSLSLSLSLFLSFPDSVFFSFLFLFASPPPLLLLLLRRRWLDISTCPQKNES